MATTRTVARKKVKAVEEPPRMLLCSLPLDVIYVIMEALKPNLDAIRAFSLATRDFRFIAQSALGRHISVNDPGRVKECVRLLNDSGFRHVRSLSLGVTNQRVILEEYWKDYLEVLKVFGQRRCLSRLWLSELPFFFLQRRQKKILKEAILGLSSSVNDLGLYGCHFSCYEEMISFVRAFPHCDKLQIQDCVTGGQDSPQNLFADLPQHKLFIADLDLTASSTNELLIDSSGFIEDAELDVPSLRTLGCDLRSTDGIRRALSAASESPIHALRFSSACSDGFQGFLASISPQWPLGSLTIGPMYHEADSTFWEAALKSFPKLPHLTHVKIIYHHRTPKAFNYSCWCRFASLLSDRGTFPHLKVVDICPTLRSQGLGHKKMTALLSVLRPLDLPGLRLMHWGGKYWYNAYYH